MGRHQLRSWTWHPGLGPTACTVRGSVPRSFWHLTYRTTPRTLGPEGAQHDQAPGPLVQLLFSPCRGTCAPGTPVCIGPAWPSRLRWHGHAKETQQMLWEPRWHFRTEPAQCSAAGLCRGQGVSAEQKRPMALGADIYFSPNSAARFN